MRRNRKPQRIVASFFAHQNELSLEPDTSTTRQYGIQKAARIEPTADDEDSFVTASLQRWADRGYGC